MARCSKHNRYACFSSECRRARRDRDYGDNAGQIVPTTDGIGIGLGGGMHIDPSDGSIGFGGIDFDSGSSSSDSGGFDGGGGGDFGGGGASDDW